MKLRDALTEYKEICVVNGNPNDLDQVGYCYPLTATTMAFEPDPKIREKVDHRHSRKANRKSKKKNTKMALPQNAKRFGKKYLHRYNRRYWNPSELYHKVKQYSFSDILWDFT